MKTANSENNNILDFQDPGMMGDELLNVPGFVNELTNHTLAVSNRPNKPLAFAGALAMITHLAGRSYVDELGGRTNLYLAALAPSAMGKEEARDTNKALAASAGILATVPDSIASGEGLEDAVAATPSLLLQADEADSLLTALRGGDSRASKMNEMVLRFFSEAKCGHAMRLKANETERRIIPHPHLTLFATGIPKFVYGALNRKSLENGLLGRCLFIETNEFQSMGEPEKRDLPARCVEAALEMSAREKKFTETGVLEPVTVTESPEAKARLRTFRFDVDEISRRYFESDLETASALFCRLYEKTKKLAMIYAISENFRTPVISADAVSWASRFATHVTRKMLYEAQFHVAEGKFERLKQRFVGLLSKHGGQLDRRTLLHNMGIDSTTFQKIVLTLEMCDMLNEEPLGYRKVMYTLNTAA